MQRIVVFLGLLSDLCFDLESSVVEEVERRCILVELERMLREDSREYSQIASEHLRLTHRQIGNVF